MASKKQVHDLTEDWWDVLMLSPHASVRDIHQAYETLRMSYLPIKRDRSIPVSPEATEQLQKLDRAFRLALDSKNPSATPSQKATSKANNKAASKASTKATPQAPTSKKDPFDSVVQEWAKTSSQNSLSQTTPSDAKVQSQTSTSTATNSQRTKPNLKLATGDTKPSKKSGNGFWLLVVVVVCGIGGYLMGSGKTPVSSTPSRTSGSAPAPRAAPSNVPTPAPPPPPSYNSATPTVMDPLVVALQRELNRKGFNAGVVDGLIGPQTSNAISAAQSSLNMYIDGLPSEALLKALSHF